MDEPEPIFAPDPITLVCLFAAFTCGMGAWLDLLTPDLLRHFGRTTSALVVRTDLRMLASGGHDDAITYRFRDSRGAMHERREHVSSLADFELPREGSRLRRWRRAGRAVSTVVGVVVVAALVAAALTQPAPPPPLSMQSRPMVGAFQSLVDTCGAAVPTCDEPVWTPP